MTNTYYTEDFLMRHGIKGQKWGVRKSSYGAYSKAMTHVTKAHKYVKKNNKEIKKTAIKTTASAVVSGAKFMASMIAATHPAIGVPVVVSSSLIGDSAIVLINK